MRARRLFLRDFHSAAAQELGKCSATVSINSSNTSQLIRSCKNLPTLIRFHAHLIVTGIAASNEIVSTNLINSYSAFQKLDSALSVFVSSPNQNVVQWNSMLRCYTKYGQHRRSIQFYKDMLNKGVDPDKYTFTFVLKACTGAFDLETGTRAHRDIVDRGLINDVFIGTALVDMYSKLGMINTAYELFDDMCHLDNVTFNAMIGGFSQNGQPHEALFLFRRMQYEAKLEPDSVTMLNLFPAVCELTSLLLCRALHCFVIRRRALSVVSNGLIDAYSKCGRPDIARQIFDGILDVRNEVSWGTMISGYVFNDQFDEALALFDILKREDVNLTQVSVVSALSAATEIGDFERGMDIHRYVIDKQMHCDLPTMTMLVSLYAKCGDADKGKVIFDEMLSKDVVAWSAMISGLTQSNQPEKAISLFREMQLAGVRPNGVTIAGVLPACSDLLDLKIGKCIHGIILTCKVVLDALVGTALVAMYAKLGDFASAHSVFNRLRHKVVVTWNAMISGYTQCGDADNALRVFHQFLATGECPDRGTVVGVISACTLLNALRTGECIHGMAIKRGLESDVHVCNALIDMYVKGCDISSSQFLFNRSRENVISWNTMIAGYMHNGCAREAIGFFHQMKAENVKPNVVTLVSILPAAAYLASLKEGQTLHSYVVRTGFESHVQIGNSLIDMYSKCGRVDVARNFFDSMDNRDTVTWNSMVAGYAIHGHAEKSLALFSDMEESGVIADSVSFLSVLSACRHGGLVSEGQNLFNSMGSGHRPQPNLEHYACMVDLFGRAGLLDEAWRMIQSMPLEPDVAVWGALLGACRTHSNLSLAEIAADQLIKLEPNNPAHYVVLSNIYLHSRRWADAGQIRKAMSTTGLIKKPGCSWVEIKNTLHAFRAGDQSHPQFKSMHALWYELHEKMRKMGYVPDTNLVLHNVEEEEKESFLHGHSERMAITFAILNTEPGREIQIVKNLRVCGDCHIITKLVSKITNRRIVVRDSSRFHHFENGLCSCKDYW